MRRENFAWNGFTIHYESFSNNVNFFNGRFLFFTFILLNIFIFSINNTLFGMGVRRKQPMQPSPKKMEMA